MAVIHVHPLYILQYNLLCFPLFVLLINCRKSESAHLKSEYYLRNLRNYPLRKPDVRNKTLLDIITHDKLSAIFYRRYFAYDNSSVHLLTYRYISICKLYSREDLTLGICNKEIC